MTAETATALAEAFREHRDAFGVSITFGQTTITAIVAKTDLARELMEGGFAESGDLSAKVLLADLPAVPAIGSAVTYQARPYKVASKAIQPGGLVGEFEIRPAKR
jgi:hypothetical protein